MPGVGQSHAMPAFGIGEIMTYPTLYRKRIIPEECIHLKDDIILTCNDDILLTQWNTLRPKKELHHGYSCYFLKEGFKVSKFLREDNSLLFWYCDIVEYLFDRESNALTVLDLLADVVVCPDGSVKVLDLDELADALEQGTLSQDLLKKCLNRLNRLLQIIYSGDFHALQKHIQNIP